MKIGGNEDGREMKSGTLKSRSIITDQTFGRAWKVEEKKGLRR